MQGNSHFLNSILVWPVNREKTMPLYCVYSKLSGDLYIQSSYVSTFPFSSPTLFPHKKEASTTLFPSVLTISIGRDAKVHHHIRWDGAIQIHVFKSTIILKKKGDYINNFRLSCLSYALLWHLVKKIIRRCLIYSIHWSWFFLQNQNFLQSVW